MTPENTPAPLPGPASGPAPGLWRGADAPDIGRRSFMMAFAATSGSLLVGCALPSRLGRAEDFAANPASGDSAGVALNAWIRITPTNEVIVAMPRVEMGQGVHTSLAQLVAEELDADWSRMRIEQAPLQRVYANSALLLNVLPLQSDDDGLLARMARHTVQQAGYWLSLQVTGGSSSVRDAWEPMRLAGATARALLIDEAAAQWKVDANECRTSQGRVVHAASARSVAYAELLKGAAQREPRREIRLKPRSEWRLVGHAVPRLDTAAKINGSAPFGADFRPEGLLFAVIRHAPVIGAELESVDEPAALAWPGVKHIVKIEQGAHAAVAVVADSTWRAMKAAAALKVQWSDSLQATLSSAHISTQLKRELDHRDGTRFRDVGDADEALADAAKTIAADYEVPFLAHATMEPVNCTAQFRDGRLRLWVGTQAASFARTAAARVAGIDESKVEIHIPYLGGGFGRRLEFDMIEQAVAVALRTEGAAVQLQWSREEDMRNDLYRPAAACRLTAALGRDGLPVAWRHRVAAPSVSVDTMLRLMPPLRELPWLDMPDKNQIEGAFDLPYAIPNLRVEQLRSHTPVPVGSWRSVGHSYNAFFVESFIDELAHAARRDPLEYRLALLEHRPRLAAVLKLAAQRAGWGTPLPGGHARGIALHESFASICAQVVEVSVEQGRPRVHRVVCAIDCGTVVNPDTVAAQMDSAVAYGLSAALHGEITIEQGRVKQGNFNDYPVLRMHEMPRVETHIVHSEAPPGGVGEPGTPPIAPAVANALFSLTGQRLRTLPLRLAA